MGMMKEGDLSDFEPWWLLVWEFDKLLICWDFHTLISSVSREKCETEKIPSEQQQSGTKQGQRGTDRLVADARKTQRSSQFVSASLSLNVPAVRREQETEATVHKKPPEDWKNLAEFGKNKLTLKVPESMDQKEIHCKPENFLSVLR